MTSYPIFSQGRPLQYITRLMFRESTVIFISQTGIFYSHESFSSEMTTQFPSKNLVTKENNDDPISPTTV